MAKKKELKRQIEELQRRVDRLETKQNLHDAECRGFWWEMPRAPWYIPTDLYPVPRWETWYLSTNTSEPVDSKSEFTLTVGAPRPT